jgi:hypothetical protein
LRSLVLALLCLFFESFSPVTHAAAQRSAVRTRVVPYSDCLSCYLFKIPFQPEPLGVQRGGRYLTFTCTSSRRGGYLRPPPAAVARARTPPTQDESPSSFEIQIQTVPRTEIARRVW